MEIKINGLSVFSEEPIAFSKAMSMAGLDFRKPCGGQGRCLRCGVRFDYGAPNVTEADEKEYEHKELNDGWRLGCCAIINKDCKIFVPDHLYAPIETGTGVNTSAISFNGNIGVAVDVGTTTIAVAIVELETGRVVATSSRANNQAEFGADVMSRIDAAVNGKSQILAKKVRSDIEWCVGELLADFSKVSMVVLSGNTTMIHLLLGYPVDGLRAFPFKAFSLEGVDTEFNNVRTLSFPSISAFVGGDIVSGLYSLETIFADTAEDIGKFIFLDLGTNSEVALWDGKRLYVTSSSAGPALEGGNISCGVPSVKGAVCHVKITPSQIPAVETIGGMDSIGICGSGIVDAIYEMRRTSIINNQGLFVGKKDTFKVAENAIITAKDVEQVILCKAAINASIQVLLNEAKVDVSEIDKFYVAGGLGTAIDKNSAAGLGIFPRELADKFEAIGNASLKGAIKLLKDGDNRLFSEVLDKAIVIELANSEDFEKLFIKGMNI